jgi:DNA mismatch repair protein MutL
MERLPLGIQTSDGRIHQLSRDVYDLIAAGEVVTSPLSVIKELVENSIDAGASHISVDIQGGGRTLMRVTDDGSGIRHEDTELALTAHATSKITSGDDLDHIGTLGFRGEALASIAAVSKLELITKTRDAKTALLVGSSAGEITEQRPVGADAGTVVTVRDLFFNTPARLKFLKSDRSETSKIVDFVSRAAVAYPDIAFRMMTGTPGANNSILFSTNGSGDALRAIQTIYGPNISEGLIPVDSDSEYHPKGSHEKDGISAGRTRVTAYISGAGKSFKTRKSQVFFVNGRYVRDSILSDAVAEAYREFMPEGRYPTVFLFLTADPGELDVNVHPAKSEIRFYDPAKMAASVRDALRTALTSKSGVPKANSRQQMINAKKAERAFYSLEDQAPAETEVPAAQAAAGLAENEDDSSAEVTGAANHENSGPESEYASVVNVKTLWSTEQAESGGDYQDITADVIDLQKLAEETYDEYNANKQEELDIEYLTLIGSVFATYLLATDADSLYLIDQHAAHERINYELMLSNMLGKTAHSMSSQSLLTPFVYQLPAPLVPFIDERVGILLKLGFEAEVFGASSVIIRTVPAFLTPGEAEVFAADVIESDAKTGLTSDRAVEKLIARACRKSVKANEKLEPEEARALLISLAACENPYTCPHGRPVFVRLTKYDIEKMFGRV